MLPFNYSVNDLCEFPGGNCISSTPHHRQGAPYSQQQGYAFCFFIENMKSMALVCQPLRELK